MQTCNGVSVCAPDAGGYTGEFNLGPAGTYSWNGPNRYIRFNTNGGANDLLSYGAALVMNWSGSQNVEYFGSTGRNTMFVNGYLSLGGGSFDVGPSPDRRLQIHAGTSQTSNLQEWLNGSNTVVAAVNQAGVVKAMEIVVTNTPWADYVFEAGYRLRSLAEVSRYIDENHRLPDVQSAAEVREKGASVGETQAKLLAKIEELTLYLVEADRRTQELQNRISRLEVIGAEEAIPNTPTDSRQAKLAAHDGAAKEPKK